MKIHDTYLDLDRSTSLSPKMSYDIWHWRSNLHTMYIYIYAHVSTKATHLKKSRSRQMGREFADIPAGHHLQGSPLQPSARHLPSSWG